MEITKTVINKEIKAVWGGSKVLVTYEVETSGYDVVANTYHVTCEIRDLESGSPELCINKVVAFTNNEDTLCADALAEELNMQDNGCVRTEFSDSVAA